MSKDVIKTNVVDDRFTFAHEGVELHDHKLATKSRGYFADAFYRFTKNKASVTASIIIIIIILFAVIVPIATPRNVQTLMDPYYSKKGPRDTTFYRLGVDGALSNVYTDRTIIYELSKGVGAEFSEENQS